MSDERPVQPQRTPKPPLTAEEQSQLRHRAVLAVAVGQLRELRRQMDALEALLMLDLRQK